MSSSLQPASKTASKVSISDTLVQGWDEERATSQIDATVDIVTAENISFNYQVAGPFRRFFAFAIDIVLVATYLFCLFWLFVILLLIMMLVGAYFFGPGIANAMEIVWLVFRGYFMVVVFLSYWFYGMLLETYWSGQTFGKWMMGLRAVSVDGQPINAVQSVLRNLIRLGDAFPLLSPAIFAGMTPDFGGDFQFSDYSQVTIFPTFMVGFFAMMFTRRFQRVGDVIAGTMVVMEQRSWLMGIAKVDDPRTPQLAALIPPKFRVSRSLAQALAIYVERRRFFSMPRRREIARHLGEPLLRIFNMPADTSHDLLLSALYYRTFVADGGDEDQAWAAYSAPANPPLGTGALPHTSSDGIAFVGPQVANHPQAGNTPSSIQSPIHIRE